MTQLVEVPADLLSPCLVAPILSVSSSQRLPQVVVGRDSNLEISGTLASTAPAHHLLLQMPAFVGWRHEGGTGLAPAQSPCLLLAVKVGRGGGGGGGASWWQNAATPRHPSRTALPGLP